MKLFVIAALIAVSAAARLEHLEQQQNLRQYLPPHQSSGLGSNGLGSGFGSNGHSSGFGSNGHGSGFGSNGRRSGFSSNGHGSSQLPFGAIAGAYGTPGPDHNVYSARASFPGASDRYLPPDQGPSGVASNSVPQFSGSFNGFGSHDLSGHQRNQNTFGARSSLNGFQSQPQSRYQSQQSPVNRQYLAPHSHSSQDIPQQAFDEQTGYHY